MTLRLRDTLTRSVQLVQPLRAGRVGMYTCGPTVYRYAHIGNLRTYLLADLIRRVLIYHGLSVRHVKNITDVGHLRDERFDRGQDRMLVAAGLESKSSAEIADAYEAAFHADEAAVNILPAHVFPRATDHIPEMLELAERLLDLGHAYASPAGNVYYAVATFPGYGRLSGNALDELRAGHRGTVEVDKRDPADFALWKAAGAGRSLKWPSPRWGEGFPGWHLECSAMARRYLGDLFDLHTGGVDNVFPHHEDEIAQSSPIVGGSPASMWVHGAFLLADGRKMAKSSGNIQRVTELAEHGLDPLAFRYLALTAAYGHTLESSDTSLAAAAVGLRSLRARVAALGPPEALGPWAGPPVLDAGAAGDRPTGEAVPGAVAGFGGGIEYPIRDRAHDPDAPLSTEGRRSHDRVVAALDDDLDLPRALVVVREILRSDLPVKERRWLVLDADAVLGLDLHRVWDHEVDDGSTAVPAEVQALVTAREAARVARSFTEADELRREVGELGWEIADGPSGPTIRRRSDA